MQIVALLVAGGKGERMNADIPKQFLLLNGTPILMHTLKQFSHFKEIVLVLPSSQFKYWQELCNTYNFRQKHTLVAGGITRFHSVKNGLEKIADNTIVAIHDGVRPLISTSLINDLVSETKSGIGVIPIIPIKDSIRKVEGENSVHVDRSNLFGVQTPQCFLSTDIQKAYTQDFSNTFTDDASVFEANGGKINTLLGEEKNLKITTQEDLNIASILI
ncbi:MAG: 2-C-methyl-D-erythritol 4-phosphate cytidylyltransferase [Cryomorphaceae bacterium]|nr:MAG: 2-C-methyl-D-erythritol 4-phosphate cytidylyltransferase [Cryomorphaceae bacterium]